MTTEHLTQSDRRFHSLNDRKSPKPYVFMFQYCVNICLFYWTTM